MKLTEPFKQVRTNILTMKDMPNASLACRLLLQEERHHFISKLSAPPIDSLAFHADPPSGQYRHDRAPHFSRTTFGHKGNRSSHVTGTKRTNTVYYCDHCHMHGHTIYPCYKIHGYPSKTRPFYPKRVASVATDAPSHDSDSIAHTGLTKDQFTHLCALLGKFEQSSDPTPADPIDESYTANVAGTFCFSPSLSSTM